MYPTLSIIVFTVSSGAGVGLLLLLIALQGFGLGAPLELSVHLAAAATGMGLLALGLVSSTFHLANPRNAWKAFNRFRTSWLSREGVFSVAVFPLALLYFGSIWMAGGDITSTGMVLAVLVALTGLATLFSQSMIYASLRTIRQWNNPLVPVAYLVLGLATGGVILTTLEALTAEASTATLIATGVLLVAGAFIKGAYYYWIGLPAGPTINTATGLTRAMRVLDTGHSHDTFLTTEFGRVLRKLDSRLLRGAVFVTAFLIPALCLWQLALGGGSGYASIAVATAIAGIMLERWLFFVEAQHVVNLYHGRQRT